VFEKGNHEVIVTLHLIARLSLLAPLSVLVSSCSSVDKTRTPPPVWGCEGSTVTLCEIDLRPGGAWRLVMLTPDGGDIPLKVLSRNRTNERLVYTECYDMQPSEGPNGSLRSCWMKSTAKRS